MSAPPSWLTDDVAQDVAVKVAKNPAAQNAAKKAAQDPAVQKAMMNEVKRQSGATSNDNAPAWAYEQSSKPVSTNDVEANMFGNGSPNSSGSDGDANPKKTRKENPYGADITPEDTAKMKNFHFGLRISYVLASALVITAAILALQQKPVLGDALLCLYGIAFALLMVGFELQWSATGSFLAANFGFLYSIVGRWIFLLFVGFMMYRISVVGKVAMAFLYFVGLMHAILICRFPYFPEYQRMLHYAYLS